MASTDISYKDCYNLTQDKTKAMYQLPSVIRTFSCLLRWALPIEEVAMATMPGARLISAIPPTPHLPVLLRADGIKILGDTCASSFSKGNLGEVDAMMSRGERRVGTKNGITRCTV